MKYPILYKSNETDFFAMGLGPIQMLKATVTQERNGIFIFEGEILTDNPLFPLVLENYIIKADADHLLKDQRFRIKRIVPNHDGKAQIYAEHVSYLSRELTIKPEVNITGSAQVALSQWKASIVESNPFVVSSDITTSASTKWRIDKVSNPMMALGGVEGSILDRWGGEYLFDNYHISLLKKRGKTATNILAYGRNITDFEQERNILSTYTSIAPYAIYTDGNEIDDNEKEIVVTVDGYVVDSEHINKLPNRVTKPIDFSSEFGHDEIPTKARLTTLAQQYIADNEIGVPTTSIKISFLDLSQTADYVDYAFLEQVNLCDDVRVHYPKLGVNTIAKVVRVVWNCLTESYDEIEIGQKRMSLASQIQEQNKVIQEINTQVNQSQVSADGKNMIFYGLYGENGLGEPNATKIGDSWFKPNGLETELYVWTGIEWKLIMSTSSFNEINETIKDLDEELGLTTTTANDAVNKAQQAIDAIGFANSAIEAADGKISSLEQNLDGFQQVVQNTYADKTTVTALATQWTQTTELANGHTSQISSLGNDLNFRVKSDEIITQINLSPENILISGKRITIDGNTYITNGVIKTAHIADLAVDGAKIANATIGSAKIINVDASKITANTLSAIQTKTGNLEVTGWLDFSTENRGLRGSYDFGDAYGGAYDARWFDGSFRLSHRHFVFTGNNYEVNPNNTKGRHLGYSESFQGQDYLKFRTWNYDGGTMYGRVDITSTYINMSNRYDTTNINFDSTNGNGYFRGLLSVNDVTVGMSANLQVYDVNTHSSANNIYFNSRRSDVADFRIGTDGNGKVIQSMAVYNRPYSSAANMFVTDSGSIGRSVSARKYKLLIEDSELLDKAKNFLQIKPKNWYDKAEVESVAKALNQREDIEPSAKTVRHHGFIADELDELDLKEVVQYGIDGQVEGLAYDRLTIYYHELIKDLYNRIEVLENGQTNSDY